MRRSARRHRCLLKRRARRATSALDAIWEAWFLEQLAHFALEGINSKVPGTREASEALGEYVICSKGDVLPGGYRLVLAPPGTVFPSIEDTLKRLLDGHDRFDRLWGPSPFRAGYREWAERRGGD